MSGLVLLFTSLVWIIFIHFNHHIIYSYYDKSTLSRLQIYFIIRKNWSFQSISSSDFLIVDPLIIQYSFPFTVYLIDQLIDVSAQELTSDAD